MDTDVREWLIAWFTKRAPHAIFAVDDNFFECEAIDSLGVIELIEDIEQHFGIQLIERDYQDRRFPTIVGLNEIIVSKRRDGSD